MRNVGFHVFKMADPSSLIP